MKTSGLFLPIILISTTLIQLSSSANILFYFGVSTYSHRIAAWPLVTALADRGHNVTFVTIYAPKEEHKNVPRVVEFFPKEFEESVGNAGLFKFGDLFRLRMAEGRMGTLKSAAQLPQIGLDVCSLFLSAKETQTWLSSAKFELVVIDGLFNECGFGLAHKFNSAKVIIFGTSSIFSWWHDTFGFPAESSWIPELHVSFPYPMTFGERIISTFMPLIQYFEKVWSYYPKMDALFREKLNDPGMPSVAELARRTSLILLSSHFSEEFARSLPPLIVPVGGIHLDKGKGQVGKDEHIAKFMDESGPNGFIYVSFGSAAVISEAPEELQHIFFSAFKNAKTRFIWKWEGERPKDMPANVLTGKWMPQQQILGHPKIKAFITHAGLMGLTEAITHAVPLIMFPLFAEQDYNSYRFHRENRGIRLEIATLTLPDMENALSDILTNTKYKENMLKTKKLFADRPSPPLETAVWWTEYVLRHDDLTSLKPLAMHQTWYERRLLDVWAFIIGLVLLVTFTVLYVFKKLVVCLFCGAANATPSTPASPSKSPAKVVATKSSITKNGSKTKVKKL